MKEHIVRTSLQKNFVKEEKKKERKLDGEFQTIGFSSLLHSWPVEVNLGSSVSDTVGHQKRRVWVKIIEGGSTGGLYEVALHIPLQSYPMYYWY